MEGTRHEHEHTTPRKYVKFSPVTWLFLMIGFFGIIATTGISAKTLYLQNNQVLSDGNGEGEPYECLKRRGCKAWNMGHDMTGVTNRIIYTVEDIPSIDNPCDCLDLCKDQSGTCHSWAWKYTESESRRRSCVISSSITLPQDVLLNFADSPSADPIDENPQIGQKVPKCLGYTLSPSSVDEKCVSGLFMLLEGGGDLC